MARMSLGVLAVAFTTGCDPDAPTDSRLGVQAEAEDSVLVRYEPCPGEVVESVRLVVSEGAVVGDEDDEVLWEVKSEDGLPTALIVGEAPARGNVLVELTRELRANEDYAVLVRTSATSADGEALVNFTPAELSRDSIWSLDRAEDPDEFARNAADTC